MRKIALILALLITAGNAFAFYDIKLPKLQYNKDILSQIRLKWNNELLSNETRKIIRREKYLIMQASSQGEAEENRSFSRKITTYYTLKDNLLSTLSHRIEISKEAEPFATTRIDFNWDKMKASFVTRNYESGKSKTKNINLTKKTILAQSLTIYFQYLINKGVKEDDCKIIIPAGNIYKMKIKISYQPEEIDVQGKKTECYKIEMKPDLGFLSIFVPGLNFWLKSDAPHDFVRYEGPEKGPLSPTVIQEIIN